MLSNILNIRDDATMSPNSKPEPPQKPTWKYDTWEASQDPTWNRATWAQTAWVVAGFALVLLSVARAAAGSIAAGMWVEPLLAALLGYVVADLGTGVFHWSVDNYGDANTPIFGGVIDSFQGHHVSPWSITERDLANNLSELGQFAVAGLLAFNAVSGDPRVLAFSGVGGVCVLFCQQFHAWAHTPKKSLPRVVLALQDMGVLLSRRDHALHHKRPYNNNYCIVSGMWNSFLDDYKVFDGLEVVIFYLTGEKPRSWMDMQLVNKKGDE